MNSAAPPLFRPWTVQPLPASSSESKPPIEVVLFPRDGTAEPFSLRSSSPRALSSWLRVDDRDPVAAFFVPGSPAFTRIAHPLLLTLATAGGLCLLGTLLCV